MKKPRTIIVVGVAAACVFGMLVWLTPDGRWLQQYVSFRIDPTAERAFDYAERHFNARTPGEYSIDRAEYFFKKAALLDPMLPYLYHELSRIAFLRGDLTSALAQINIQIALHGDSAPNSFYVRGLIEGYAGDYAAAAKDYETYLKYDPTNWAGLNDYAWILLKAGRHSEALTIADRGLKDFPDNPWLLNSRATALYELERYAEALGAVQKADSALTNLTESEWLNAYPGNDPLSAQQGIASFKKAVADNMHTISLATASSTIQ